MLIVFTGVLAFVISLMGLTERVEPRDLPKNSVPLQISQVGGGMDAEFVPVKAMSDLKYANISRQQYDYSCGSAALVTVLNFFVGLPIKEQEAMEGMLDKGEKDKIVARRGFSLLDMKRYLASIDVKSAGFRAERADLLELKQPAIVPIDYGGFKHFVVLRGARDGRAYIADPSAGNFVISLDEFMTWWDRNTLFLVYPKDGQPPVANLALTDHELGVMYDDYSRNTDAFNRALAMQSAVEGHAGGISVRRW